MLVAINITHLTVLNPRASTSALYDLKLPGLFAELLILQKYFGIVGLKENQPHFL